MRGVMLNVPVEIKRCSKLVSRELESRLVRANYWAGYYETMSKYEHGESEDYRLVARENMKRMNRIAGESAACLTARGHYSVETGCRARMARWSGKERYWFAITGEYNEATRIIRFK